MVPAIGPVNEVPSDEFNFPLQGFTCTPYGDKLYVAGGSCWCVYACALVAT